MTNKPEYHLNNPDTKIYIGDSRVVLPTLPHESVDLIFADPPFNWEVKYGDWKDNLPRDEYLKFTYEWLEQCIGILAPHGSFWINIPDDTAAEIVVYLKNRGLSLINWCIWHFRFGQCRRSNFIVSKVHVLYFAKNPNERIWNPNEILEPSDRATMYADPRTMETNNPGMRVPLDVWYGPYWGRIQGNNKERRKGHQNQIPEVYLQRVIKACSNKGDVVLDPFLGSGTTCTIARALGRKSIGIEFSPSIAKSAYNRIKDGPVRIINDFHNIIISSFFKTHQGLSTEEVIIDDELRNRFLDECSIQIKEKGLSHKSEFECNWELFNLRKINMIGSSGKKKPVNKNNGYKEASEVADILLRKSSDSLDRVLCDPVKRNKFDDYAQKIKPGINSYLVRKAALNLRKKGKYA